MIWTDFNGNFHSISDYVALKMQQPNCKYLLPCGLCSLFPELKTCPLTEYEVQNNDGSKTKQSGNEE